MAPWCTSTQCALPARRPLRRTSGDNGRRPASWPNRIPCHMNHKTPHPAPSPPRLHQARDPKDEEQNLEAMTELQGVVVAGLFDQVVQLLQSGTDGATATPLGGGFLPDTVLLQDRPKYHGLFGGWAETLPVLLGPPRRIWHKFQMPNAGGVPAAKSQMRQRTSKCDRLVWRDPSFTPSSAESHLPPGVEHLEGLHRQRRRRESFLDLTAMPTFL